MFDRAFDYIIVTWLAALTGGFFAHWKRDEKTLSEIKQLIAEIRDELQP